MGGVGPAPKDPSERRNRNPKQRGEWVDLPSIDKPILGPITDYVKDPLPESSVQLWESWRADPVTTQWLPSDVRYAVETIRLHADDSLKRAEEIRRRSDGLGLTPKGKRDLRWRTGLEPDPANAAKTKAGKPTGRSEQRARLSVVK